MITVSQILRSKSAAGVLTVKPGATVAAAAELLSSMRIGAVIVPNWGGAAGRS